MLKYIFIVLLTFFGLKTNLSFGQTTEQIREQADKLFEKEQFVEATPLYLKLLTSAPRDIDINYRYGTCLLFSGNKRLESFKYLNFAVSNETVDKKAFFYLGKAQHLNYQFAEAIVNYNKYKTKAGSEIDMRLDVDRQIEMCENGKRLITSFTDLIVQEKIEIDLDKFFRLYNLQNIGGDFLVTTDFQSKVDKKKEHVPLIHFPKSKAYFYYSSYGDDEKSGKDIYVRRKLPNGEWGVPQKLAGDVNTLYDEDFPFFHPADNYLYFSSKGHNSMGGYDVFRSKYDAETNSFGKAENLDFAISTPSEDLLYIVDSLNQNAYFSSNRQSQQGKVYVYKVRVEKVPIQISVVKGSFISSIDPENKKVYIEVKDYTSGELVGKFNSNDQGVYMITFPKGGKYEYSIRIEGKQEVYKSIVSIPFLKDFKPLKQKIVNDLVNDVENVKVVDLFNEEVEDASGILAQVVKMKADLAPNADQFKLLTSEKVDTKILSDLGLANMRLNEVEGVLSKELVEAETASNNTKKLENKIHFQAIETLEKVNKLDLSIKEKVAQADRATDTEKRYALMKTAESLTKKQEDLRAQARKDMLLADSIAKSPNSVEEKKVADLKKVHDEFKKLLESNKENEALQLLAANKDLIQSSLNTKPNDILQNLIDKSLTVQSEIDELKKKDDAFHDAIEKINREDYLLEQSKSGAKSKELAAIQSKINANKSEIELIKEEKRLVDDKLSSKSLYKLDLSNKIDQLQTISVINDTKNVSKEEAIMAVNSFESTNSKTLKSYVNLQLTEMEKTLPSLKDSDLSSSKLLVNLDKSYPSKYNDIESDLTLSDAKKNAKKNVLDEQIINTVSTQLYDIEKSLSSDPTNSDLLASKAELVELKSKIQTNIDNRKIAISSSNEIVNNDSNQDVKNGKSTTISSDLSNKNSGNSSNSTSSTKPATSATSETSATTIADNSVKTTNNTSTNSTSSTKPATITTSGTSATTIADNSVKTTNNTSTNSTSSTKPTTITTSGTSATTIADNSVKTTNNTSTNSTSSTKPTTSATSGTSTTTIADNSAKTTNNTSTNSTSSTQPTTSSTNGNSNINVVDNSTKQTTNQSAINNSTTSSNSNTTLSNTTSTLTNNTSKVESNNKQEQSNQAVSEVSSSNSTISNSETIDINSDQYVKGIATDESIKEVIRSITPNYEANTKSIENNFSISKIEKLEKLVDEEKTMVDGLSKLKTYNIEQLKALPNSQELRNQQKSIELALSETSQKLSANSTKLEVLKNASKQDVAINEAIITELSPNYSKNVKTANTNSKLSEVDKLNANQKEDNLLLAKIETALSAVDPKMVSGLTQEQLDRKAQLDNLKVIVKQRVEDRADQIVVKTKEAQELAIKQKQEEIKKMANDIKPDHISTINKINNSSVTQEEKFTALIEEEKAVIEKMKEVEVTMQGIVSKDPNEKLVAQKLEVLRKSIALSENNIKDLKQKSVDLAVTKINKTELITKVDNKYSADTVKINTNAALSDSIKKVNLSSRELVFQEKIKTTIAANDKKISKSEDVTAQAQNIVLKQQLIESTKRLEEYKKPVVIAKKELIADTIAQAGVVKKEVVNEQKVENSSLQKEIRKNYLGEKSNLLTEKKATVSELTNQDELLSNYEEKLKNDLKPIIQEASKDKYNVKLQQNKSVLEEELKTVKIKREEIKSSIHDLSIAELKNQKNNEELKQSTSQNLDGNVSNVAITPSTSEALINSVNPDYKKNINGIRSNTQLSAEQKSNEIAKEQSKLIKSLSALDQSTKQALQSDPTNIALQNKAKQIDATLVQLNSDFVQKSNEIVSNQKVAYTNLKNELQADYIDKKTVIQNSKNRTFEENLVEEEKLDNQLISKIDTRINEIENQNKTNPSNELEVKQVQLEVLKSSLKQAAEERQMVSKITKIDPIYSAKKNEIESNKELSSNQKLNSLQANDLAVQQKINQSLNQLNKEVVNSNDVSKNQEKKELENLQFALQEQISARENQIATEEIKSNTAVVSKELSKLKSDNLKETVNQLAPSYVASINEIQFNNSIATPEKIEKIISQENKLLNKVSSELKIIEKEIAADPTNAQLKQKSAALAEVKTILTASVQDNSKQLIRIESKVFSELMKDVNKDYLSNIEDINLNTALKSEEKQTAIQNENSKTVQIIDSKIAQLYEQKKSVNETEYAQIDAKINKLQVLKNSIKIEPSNGIQSSKVDNIVVAAKDAAISKEADIQIVDFKDKEVKDVVKSINPNFESNIQTIAQNSSLTKEQKNENLVVEETNMIKALNHMQSLNKVELEKNPSNITLKQKDLQIAKAIEVLSTDLALKNADLQTTNNLAQNNQLVKELEPDYSNRIAAIELKKDISEIEKLKLIQTEDKLLLDKLKNNSKVIELELKNNPSASTKSRSDALNSLISQVEETTSEREQLILSKSASLVQQNSDKSVAQLINTVKPDYSVKINNITNGTNKEEDKLKAILIEDKALLNELKDKQLKDESNLKKDPNNQSLKENIEVTKTAIANVEKSISTNLDKAVKIEESKIKSNELIAKLDVNYEKDKSNIQASSSLTKNDDLVNREVALQEKLKQTILDNEKKNSKAQSIQLIAENNIIKQQIVESQSRVEVLKNPTLASVKNSNKVEDKNLTNVNSANVQNEKYKTEVDKSVEIANGKVSSELAKSSDTVKLKKPGDNSLLTSSATNKVDNIKNETQNNETKTNVAQTTKPITDKPTTTITPVAEKTSNTKVNQSQNSAVSNEQKSKVANDLRTAILGVESKELDQAFTSQEDVKKQNELLAKYQLGLENELKNVSLLNGQVSNSQITVEQRKQIIENELRILADKRKANQLILDNTKVLATANDKKIITPEEIVSDFRQSILGEKSVELEKSYTTLDELKSQDKVLENYENELASALKNNSIQPTPIQINKTKALEKELAQIKEKRRRGLIAIGELEMIAEVDNQKPLTIAKADSDVKIDKISTEQKQLEQQLVNTSLTAKEKTEINKKITNLEIEKSKVENQLYVANISKSQAESKLDSDKIASLSSKNVELAKIQNQRLSSEAELLVNAADKKKNIQEKNFILEQALVKQIKANEIVQNAIIDAAFNSYMGNETVSLLSKNELEQKRRTTSIQVSDIVQEIRNIDNQISVSKPKSAIDLNKKREQLIHEKELLNNQLTSIDIQINSISTINPTIENEANDVALTSDEEKAIASSSNYKSYVEVAQKAIVVENKIEKIDVELEKLKAETKKLVIENSKVNSDDKSNKIKENIQLIKSNEIARKELIKELEINQTEAKILTSNDKVQGLKMQKMLLNRTQPVSKQIVSTPVIVSTTLIPKETDNAVATSKVVPMISLPASGLAINKNPSATAVSTPIPVDVKNPSGLVYRVQVGAFSKPIPQDLFKSFTPVSGEKLNDNGITRYMAGYFNAGQKALEAQNQIRNIGYKDAFVVAYCDGLRVSFAEARELERTRKCIPKGENELLVEVAQNTAQVLGTKFDSTMAVEKTNIPENQNSNYVKATPVETRLGLFYTVQIGVFNGAVEPERLKNIEPVVSKKLPNALVRYSTGMFHSIDEARPKKEEAISRGIADAFITAYYKGERITLVEAKRLLDQNGNGILEPVKPEEKRVSTQEEITKDLEKFVQNQVEIQKVEQGKDSILQVLTPIEIPQKVNKPLVPKAQLVTKKQFTAFPKAELNLYNNFGSFYYDSKEERIKSATYNSVKQLPILGSILNDFDTLKVNPKVVIPDTKNLKIDLVKEKITGELANWLIQAEFEKAIEKANASTSLILKNIPTNEIERLTNEIEKLGYIGKPIENELIK